jgi:beta-lactamase regulating signal transducer with metallopeptidase domain
VDTLLAIGLGNALLATVLALLVAGVARACRRPALAHALWLLVLLKLVTPPLIHIPLPWPSASPEVVDPVPEPPLAELDLPPMPADGSSDPAPEMEDMEPPPAEEPVAPPAAGFPWKETMAGVWVAGSLVWWLLAGVRLIRFRRTVGALARPAPDEVVRRAEELAGRLGLRRCPSVWMVPAALSPMLLALGRSPRLFLPEGLWARLSAEQRDTLLAHELAHLRRGDHWVRRLELLALGLYWWLPVAWWCRRRLQETEAFLSRPTVPLGASGLGQVPLLKRRLTMILGGISRRTLSWVGLGVVLGLGALVLPLMPTLAGDPPRPAVTAYLAHPGHDVVKWKHDHTACTACHQADTHAFWFTPKKPAWQAAHQEVLRLMAEVKAQRARLQQSEDRLRAAIEKLQAATRALEAPRKGGDMGGMMGGMEGPARRPATSEERLKSLEKKLDALLRDVDALRKEMKPRKGGATNTSGFGGGGYGMGFGPGMGGLGGVGSSGFGGGGFGRGGLGGTSGTSGLGGTTGSSGFGRGGLGGTGGTSGTRPGGGHR